MRSDRALASLVGKRQLNGNNKESHMSANLLQTINTGLGRRTSQAPEREDFSKIATAVRIPNLIEIQRESYNRFLQMDLLPEEREAPGSRLSFSRFFRSLIFAAPPRSTSSSTRSVTGSANADVWKVLTISGQTVKTAARPLRSIPWPPERRFAIVAAHSILFARNFAKTAASPLV